MGSLFVGPYRQNNINGLYSKTILQNIINSIPESKFLICRNLFVDPIIINEFDDQSIKKHENITIDSKINTLIQHVPPNAIYLSQYLDHNICIPILDNRILTDEQLYRLSLCTKVLTDSYLIYTQLKDYLSNIYFFQYDPIITREPIESKINLGAYHNTNKFYFMGTLQHNKDLLLDLMLSFGIFSQTHDNTSLVLLMFDANKKETDSIQNIVNSIYKQLNVNNVFVKIIYNSIPNKLETIIEYHQYCDVLLNINDNTRNSLQANYARVFGSNIINDYDLKYEKSIMRNDIINSNGFLTPTQNSILEALQNFTSGSLNTHNISPDSIGKFIWN